MKNLRTVVTYDILQVIPCRGVLAVYANKKDGKVVCETEVVEMLALATKTTRFIDIDPTPDDAGNDMEHERLVVGVSLCDGVFDVCDDNGLFVGYCKDNDVVAEKFLDICERRQQERDQELAELWGES